MSYDTFGENFCQFKIGPRKCRHYKIGDAVPVSDGIYASSECFLVIKGGRFIAEFPAEALIDKWGEPIVLDIESRSPVLAAMKEAEQKYNK